MTQKKIWAFVFVAGLAISATARAQLIDVSAQIHISYSGYVLNRADGTFDTQATLKNSLTAVRSPIELIVRGLPNGVTLANASGLSSGSPYVIVGVAGGVLASGASATTILRFANPGRVQISFTTEVLAVVTAASGGQFVARGINNSTIVGATCPHGFALGGIEEPCFNLVSGVVPAFSPSTAMAEIDGKQHTLSSLADLTPCGFDSRQSTIAMAIAEGGAIVVEGGKPSQGVNDEFRISCLLTPTASVNGIPQYRVSPLTMVSAGINSTGTVVGATCPSGFALGGIEEPCFNLVSGVVPAFKPSTAVAEIAGKQYALSSLADLTPCGFDSTQSTIAMAVSESGAIVVEGGKPSQGVNDEFRVSCLLTPTAPVNGIPHYRAAAQRMVSTGINSAGTVVGATCPSGFALGGIEEPCFNLVSGVAPAFKPSTAVAEIAGKEYTLSSLVDLTPCGFDSTQSTIAMAVSESGAIVVEGGKPSQGVNDEFRLSCLLTPMPPVNGVPTFGVAPL